MTLSSGPRLLTTIVTLMERLTLAVCTMLAMLSSSDRPIGWLISSNQLSLWTPSRSVQPVSSPSTPQEGPKSIWNPDRPKQAESPAGRPRWLLFAEAKGVAGLGKAGGDGTGGSDKAGQQVPPEVYIALTYAGSAFLLTLSVPLILYGLNKLLNKIEDCFGCGPSSKAKKRLQAKPPPPQPAQTQPPSPPPPPPAQTQTQTQTQLAQLPQQHLNQLHQASMQAPLSTGPLKYNMSSDNEGGCNVGNNNGHKDNTTNNFNGNLPVQQHQRPQLLKNQQLQAHPTMPNPMTLPFAQQFNYKTSTIQANFQHPEQAQVAQQQPYIISSQHL